VCGQHLIICPWYWSWRASVSQAARHETLSFLISSRSPTRSSIPWHLQNLKIHYMFTLHQANQTQLTPSYVISLGNLNAILPFYIWSTKWPLPSVLSGENSSLFFSPCMLCVLEVSPVLVNQYYRCNIWWWVVSSSLCNFCHLSLMSFAFDPNSL